jgi:hypothetical protein
LDPANLGSTLRMACEAHLLLGQAEQAISTCEKARGLYRDDLIIGLFLAAAYANHSDLLRAAAARAEVLRIAPGYTVAQLRAKRYARTQEARALAWSKCFVPWATSLALDGLSSATSALRDGPLERLQRRIAAVAGGGSNWRFRPSAVVRASRKLTLE